MNTRLNIKNSGPRLTSKAIDKYEQEIGGKLSEGYKNFLLKHNGGWPEPEVYFPSKGDQIPVAKFEIIPTDGSQSVALQNLQELGEEGFLPIAWCFSEQDICMSLSVNDDSVYITDYKYRDDSPIDVVMLPLANSFDEFLEGLVETPNPYCHLEWLGKEGDASDLAQYLMKGNSIDSSGKNNFTIICEAIKFNNLPMVQACFDKHATLSGAVKVAMENGRKDFIEMLIEHGADINERDELGHTPLFYHGGTGLPGEIGAQRREMEELMLRLGAIKE